MMIDQPTNRRFMKRVEALRHHSGWILAGALACAAGALVVSLYSPKIYRSTTYVLISESKIGSSSRDSDLQQMAMLPTFVPFVDNDELIGESLKQLHLDQPPYGLTPDKFRRKNYLDVRVPKSTRLLELDIEFPDARLAADLANDIAQRAVKLNGRLNTTDTTATQEFLKKELDQARTELAEVSGRRLKVHEAAHIEDLDAKLTTLLSERDKLSPNLQQLQMELVQDESKSKSLERALADEPKTILLKKSVTSDRFTEQAAEKAFPEGTPLSVTEESLNTIREGIRQDLVKATVASATDRAAIAASTARLDQVNKEISRLLSRMTGLRSEIETVDQEYALATEALKTASREYDAASVNVSSKSQDIKQIAPAQVSERPVRPRILINTVMGFLLGLLVLGGGVVGLQIYRDENRQGPFDVQDKTVTVNRR
jgi:uncharacterized protein involved in exopolysaccharide biosynthesis